MKEKLVFAGAWDEEPLVSWPWQAAESTEHFYKLTGFRIRPLTFFDRNGLHAQYFFAGEVKRMERKVKLMSNSQRVKYVKKICADYNKYSKEADFLLKRIYKVNPNKLTNEEIVRMMEKMYQSLAIVTMPVWFVLFLDLWFPLLDDRALFKKIGAKVRDHSGHQHWLARPFKRKVWGVVAERLSLNSKDFLLLFPDEINCILKGDKKPFKKMKLRKQLYVTTILNKKYEIFEGKKARQLLKKYLPKRKVVKGGELSGFSSYPGKVTGKIRKIFHYRDYDKFKKGEVLVAFQTLVDYLPLMRKARAILTEFGGITSHAAVVSRELKTPCIVGIKNLTSSLKNGDKVEVDAMHGIIKKL